MLRLSPRSITAAVMAFFFLLLGVQHFLFSLLSQHSDKDGDIVRALEQRIPLLFWLERTDYDMHLRYHKPGKPHPDVVIVDVSERSLQELGQFPFSRNIHGKLIRRLENYGAKVAAFDITFPEKERNLAMEELKAARNELASAEGEGSRAVALLDHRIQAQDNDDAFARALNEVKMPVILGFAFTGEHTGESGAKGRSPKDVSPEHKEELAKHDIFRRQVTDNSFLHRMEGQIPLLPHLDLMRSLRPPSGLGFFVAYPDIDSVIRNAVGVAGYNGSAVPALAVQAVARYLGVEPMLDGENGLRIRDRSDSGKLDVPLFPDGSYLLRYYGGSSKEENQNLPGRPLNDFFRYVEYSDVVSDNPAIQEAARKAVNGKIVFIGVTAVGLKDIRANPFTKDYPGVEVHATFASNMLTRSYLEKDSRYFYLGYLSVFLIGLIVSILVYRMHPLLAFLPSLVLLAAIQFLAHDLFFNNGVVVPTMIPSLAGLSVFFSGVLYRYFTEEREKRMVRNAFSRYVSGPVVEEILRDQSKLKLGGQKKELTVMFCDLKGFTKLSENMDAAQLTTLLNEYFTRMTRIILRNKGTLDKYMGDNIMCFWGAPLELPNHAELACRTALEMVAELEAINTEWKEKFGLTIGMRIGLNTGEMNVGNMGSEQVFSYTVMGDNVNLGSRLEGVNNVYGTTVLASEFTIAAAGGGFTYRPLDRVQVKGKEEAVRVFELMGFAEGAPARPDWLHAFEKGMEAYEAGYWEEAEASFGTCLALNPGDLPTKVFLDRIRDLRSQPGQGWDGVWKLETK